MKVVNGIARMQTLSRIVKREGKSIGFVPTMGALHDGHLSLAKAAKKHTDIVVMSIFVNPAQFGPREDFERYPRNLKRDESLAMNAGVDILFCPTTADMYPRGYDTYISVQRLSATLCGASRPGHFAGVATVVAKLINIVNPSIAYFGQKDAQQTVIIQKMAADLNMNVEIKVLPIVREADGLAVSSRNRYLSAVERLQAIVLHQALEKAASLIDAGERDSRKITRAMKQMIGAEPAAKIDYIVFVDARTLQPMARISGEVLVALAVFIGKTRLIDNITRKVS